MLALGNLQLKSTLFLSPLAGYTNLPFRLTIREIGGLDLATTDLVNARSLLEKNPKAFKLIETCPADRPLAVQLFGSVPEEMRDAALYLESIGVSSVDINMGCPVRKVCRVGGGSATYPRSAQYNGPRKKQFPINHQQLSDGRRKLSLSFRLPARCCAEPNDFKTTFMRDVA